MMRPDHRVTHDTSFQGDGMHQRDVGKMGATRVRIVDDERVTRPGILRANRGHRLRHRTEVHRNVCGLRHHFTVGREERR
jgi:hypothetical protein